VNDIQITMIGNMVTDPVLRTVGDDIAVTGFRVASTPRRFDQSGSQWRDGETIFLSVTCWRRLAQNAAASLHKGDGVIVQGRLISRSFDDKEQQRRSVLEVEALSVGPDLNRGTAQLVRTARTATGTADPWAEPLRSGPASTPGSGESVAGNSVDPFRAREKITRVHPRYVGSVVVCRSRWWSRTGWRPGSRRSGRFWMSGRGGCCWGRRRGRSGTAG